MTPQTSTQAAAHKEQRLLATSMAINVVLALVGVSVGLWLGSSSITFDGFYLLIEAAMTAIALWTVRLIARGEDRKFQYGYWHLEPMLALINGLVLAFACLYAFLDGLNGLLAGGRDVPFGLGAIYAALSSVASFGMYAYLWRSARHLESQTLDVDSRGWLISGILSTGLCLSFILGGVLTRSGAAWLAPYVDPLILMVVAVCLVPFPMITLRRAAPDVLMIAPAELDQHVRDVAAGIARKHGFAAFNSHVTRSGRQQFVEMGFAASPGASALSFEQLDDIRHEIAAALGSAGPGYWLTVDFTADPRWI